jgi:hypothetical protein
LAEPSCTLTESLCGLVEPPWGFAKSSMVLADLFTQSAVSLIPTAKSDRCASYSAWKCPPPSVGGYGRAHRTAGADFPTGIFPGQHGPGGPCLPRTGMSSRGTPAHFGGLLPQVPNFHTSNAKNPRTTP